MAREKAVQRQISKRERGGYGGEVYFDMDFLDDKGIKVWKSKGGDNFISIIPPSDADAYFGLEIYAHFNVGYSGGNYLCPRMMSGGTKRCPLCEEYRRVRSDEAVDDQIKRTLNPFPPRFLFFIVDRLNGETDAEGIQLYDAPMTVNDNILALSKDRRTGELLDISDPVDGFILQFTRTGVMLRTKYEAFILEELVTPLLENWLKQVPEFEDCIVIHSYDELRDAYFGEGAEAEAEAGAQPERARRRSARTTRSREPAEDEEEVEEPRARTRRQPPIAGDEEEEAAPRRRSSCRPSRAGSVKEAVGEIGDDLDEGDYTAGDEEDDPHAESRQRLKEIRAARRGEGEKGKRTRGEEQEGNDEEEAPF